MIPSPWKRFALPAPDREYAVLLTYLPLRRFRTIPRFLRDTRNIAEQLETAPGLMGYSFKAQLLSRRFWTLSAWEDEDALRAFSYDGVHRDVMLSLRAEMDPTRFIRWRLRGRDLPPTWKDALGRAAAEPDPSRAI